jgi:rSAM/selenodomain-associated transferase 2
LADPPASPTPNAVAAIVPTLNEAQTIIGAIDALRALGFSPIIVADGGSEDETLELARSPGVVALSAPRGRAAQMNAGAAATKAEVLVFVHADTRLPAQAPQMIARALADARVVGGSFRLSFDRRHPLLAISSWLSRFETYWTTFGDHGFFVRRAVFETVGGFPDWPLLEDVELRRRLRAAGRFVKLGAAAITSARRFFAEGVLRRQLANGSILVLHAAGVSARRLKRWYR